MTSRRFLLSALFVTFFAGSLALAQDQQKLTPQRRFELVRALNAEFVFVHKNFPLGVKGVILHTDGRMEPNDQEMMYLLANNGWAAKVGDRVQITNIEFRDKEIVFDINGGLKKKKKWYERITVGGMGGETPVSPQTQQPQIGSALILKFKDKVPNLSIDELKKLVAPIFDFGAGKSATEAYVEKLPPQVKRAIHEHRVLVGMDREMVTMAKGRPAQKVRERGEDGFEYEEWIYGEPPSDVEFIRFNADEVFQVKIMKVTGEKIVRTEREFEPVDRDTLAKEIKEERPERTGTRPSLRRDGEEVGVPLDPVSTGEEGTNEAPAEGPHAPEPPQQEMVAPGSE